MKILKEGDINNKKNFSIRIVSFCCQECLCEFEALDEECEIDQKSTVYSDKYLTYVEYCQYTHDCPMDYCKEPCYSTNYKSEILSYQERNRLLTT